MVDFLHRNIVPITIVLGMHYGFFLVASLFWHLEADVAPDNGIVDIEVLSSEDVDQLIEVLDIPDEVNFNMAEVENMVADANAEEGSVANNRNWNDADMSEDVYNELKAFEQAQFDKLAEQHGGDDPNEASNAELIEDPTDNTNDNNNSDNPDEAKTNAATSVATVTFDLTGRYDMKLPAPSYLCIGSGKVVLNIKVNTKGKITDAKVNEALSSASPCLLDAGLRYARKSLFNSDITAAKSQSGTITYVFVRQ